MRKLNASRVFPLDSINFGAPAFAMTELFNTNCRFDQDRHDKIIHSIKTKADPRLESSAVLVLCLNQGRTSDSHCGKQALFNATPNSVSVLSEIASGRRLGEWLQ